MSEYNDTMEVKVFPAVIEELDNATDYISVIMEEAEVSPKVMMQISVAFEEMFVNVAHYAYPEGQGNVSVGINIKDETITIQLSDQGIPFDPLKKTDPDVTLDAEERQIGGLGIYMVKKSMDEVSYEYVDGENRFTMKKRFGK